MMHSGGFLQGTNYAQMVNKLIKFKPFWLVPSPTKVNGPVSAQLPYDIARPRLDARAKFITKIYS